MNPRFFLPLFHLFAVALAPAAFAQDVQTVSMDFHDIHREGKVAILGHFGLPIGQIVTVVGRREEPSKVSNDQTLHFTKVNGITARKFGESPWPPLIQIRNIDALPIDEEIVLEGYEMLIWVGNPPANWHVEVEFVVTKVVAPKGVKLNALGS